MRSDSHSTPPRSRDSLRATDSLAQRSSVMSCSSRRSSSRTKNPRLRLAATRSSPDNRANASRMTVVLVSNRSASRTGGSFSPGCHSPARIDRRTRSMGRVPISSSSVHTRIMYQTKKKYSLLTCRLCLYNVVTAITERAQHGSPLEVHYRVRRWICSSWRVMRRRRKQHAALDIAVFHNDLLEKDHWCITPASSPPPDPIPGAS